MNARAIINTFLFFIALLVTAYLYLGLEKDSDANGKSHAMSSDEFAKAVLQLWPLRKMHTENISYLQIHSRAIRSRQIADVYNLSYLRIDELTRSVTGIARCGNLRRSYYLEINDSLFQAVRYYPAGQKSHLTVRYLRGSAGSFELEVFDTTGLAINSVKSYLNLNFGDRLAESLGSEFRFLKIQGVQYELKIWYHSNLRFKLLESSIGKHLILEVSDKISIAGMDTVRWRHIALSANMMATQLNIPSEVLPEKVKHGFYHVEYSIDKKGNIELLKIPDYLDDSDELLLKSYYKTQKVRPDYNLLGEPVNGIRKKTIIAVGSAVKIIE
ncbi:MAG: hypothetical protein AAFP70_04735 [Calditrichota bacterium]